MNQQHPDRDSDDSQHAAKVAWSTRNLRREAAKRSHPDLGGDPAEFIRVMQAISDGSKKQFNDIPSATSPSQPPTRTAARGVTTYQTTATPRIVRTVRTTSRRLIRELRQHIPRSLPGSRRYGQL